jgi:hypothetical protein
MAQIIFPPVCTKITGSGLIYDPCDEKNRQYIVENDKARKNIEQQQRGD